MFQINISYSAEHNGGTKQNKHVTYKHSEIIDTTQDSDTLNNDDKRSEMLGDDLAMMEDAL